MLFSIILIGFIILILLIHLNGLYNENYWKRRNVAFYDKYKTFGPFMQFFVEKRPMFLILQDLYNKYDEPAVGFGSFLTPAIYVKDLKNIKSVLHTDFHSFNDRGLVVNDGDTLADNLLFMTGDRWKLTRHHMSPMFTSAKLKNMYYIMDKSAMDFVEFLIKNPENLKKKAFDNLKMFSNAAICASVFGIGTGSTFDSPFLRMATEASGENRKNNLKFAIAHFSTSAYRWFNFKIFAEYEEFFIGAMKKVLSLREREDVKKHDFLDLCINLQKHGKMVDKDTGLELEPTDEFLAAQGFFFFLAGVETTSSAMFNTMYELSANPDILSRLHKEIDSVFDKCNGNITYDQIQEMKYLDKVFAEALRLHPPIGFLTRVCVRDTILPVGNIKISKGTKVFLPLFELHHDAKYFPNPNFFDPERFSNEVTHTNEAYMPFGKGNRICIGKRYANLQAKAGIIHVLRHFTVVSISNMNDVKYRIRPLQVRLDDDTLKFVPRSWSTDS